MTYHRGRRGRTIGRSDKDVSGGGHKGNKYQYLLPLRHSFPFHCRGRLNTESESESEKTAQPPCSNNFRRSCPRLVADIRSSWRQRNVSNLDLTTLDTIRGIRPCPSTTSARSRGVDCIRHKPPVFAISENRPNGGKPVAVSIQHNRAAVVKTDSAAVQGGQTLYLPFSLSWASSFSAVRVTVCFRFFPFHNQPFVTDYSCKPRPLRRNSFLALCWPFRRWLATRN